MHKLISFLFLYAAFFSVESMAENFYYWSQNEKVSISLTKYNDLLISDNCIQNNKCDALKIFKASPKSIKLSNVIQGNYAGAYCKKLQGTILILIDEKKNEYEFCQFKDKSLISAWKLYNEHSKKTGNKK
jgi:uncharacterized protein